MIAYKIDIIQALKDKGFSTYYLQKNKIIQGKQIQDIKEKRNISFKTLNTICELLEMQPGDLIEHIPENVK